MNPEIAALYELQQRDRQLTGLERRLESIPARVRELDEDLARLEAMLEAERKKCQETRDFQRNQEMQLVDEEELLRQSRAKLAQIKNARELNATQREIDTTRRMASARSEEIVKLQKGVEEAEQRIAAMMDSLTALRAQAEEEKARLAETEQKLRKRIERLREGRDALTAKLERDVLRTYDRIRKRVGGVAFVGAVDGRCSACKMVVPHQIYVQLRRGDEIPSCESCGRLLYWSGHFPKEESKTKDREPKASPPKKRSAADKD